MTTEFLKYTLDIIRQNGTSMSWLEEKRLEFAPLLSSRLKLLIQDSRPFIFICDDERAWYEEYFSSNINSRSHRPFVPFFSLKSLCKNTISTSNDIALLNDLLELSFPNGYVFFYVGLSTNKMAQVAKSKDDSLLVVFDDKNIHNSLYIPLKESNLDSKLISLYKFFDSSLEAILLSKVNI